MPEPSGYWEKKKLHYDPAVDAWLRRQYGMSTKAPESGLSPVVDDWLQALRLTAEAAVNPKEPAETSKEAARRNVFIIRQDFGRTLVDLARQRQLANGVWGAQEAWTWDQLIKQPRANENSPEEDRQLAVELAWAQETTGGLFRYLEGAKGASLLARLIATGRCYWLGAGKNRRPLTLGPERNGELGWETGTAGQQRAAILINPKPKAILTLDPFWYLDDTNSICGPVQLPVPAVVARVWLKAPEIKAEEGGKLATTLDKAPLVLTVPKPKRLQVQHVPDCRPIPCLRLLTMLAIGMEEEEEDGTSPEEISAARLEFDYEGVMVPYRQRGDTVQVIEGAIIREIKRRPNLENRHAKSMESTGLIPAALFPGFDDFKLEDHDFVSDDADKWIHFVRQIVPGLKAEKWRIIEDPSFRWRVVEAEEWTTNAHPETDGSGHDAWFELEMGVIVEGSTINLLPLLIQFLAKDPKGLSRERLEKTDSDAVIPLRLPDGRNLLFPLARARQMLGVLFDLYDNPPLGKNGGLRVNRLRAAELAGTSDWRWMGPQELNQLARKLQDFKGIQPVPPPKGLQASLRPYQQEGVNWLQFLREFELGGVLADDMGLGKTIQTLAHLVCEQENGRGDLPSLVVAPTSLMTNWKQEAARFAPSLRVLVLHGSDRKEHFERIGEHDLVLTTYPLLPRDLPHLIERRFHYVILDEAQFIKNPKTSYAQAVYELKARHRLCLTGTPMENHLGELWSLFRFLLPGFLGDESRFNSTFRRPIERHQDENRRKVLGRRVAPFLLRRRKEQVALELPPKTEITQAVELGSAQRDLYESVRLAMHSRVREEVARKGLARSHIIVLDALLKLRQICCHPQLLSLPAAKKVKDSAKLDVLMELLVQMVAEGRRVLLFSQFTSMLALIEEKLRAEKIGFVMLTGDTKDRATPVEQFQSGKIPVFLISLKAGGTGLNLTAADTVIHYDPWWNPAVENQATDRAHRIGQAKNVFVYKLIATGTVEEKIAALQDRKKALVEGLLSEGNTGKLELGSEDIDFLFGPLG